MGKKWSEARKVETAAKKLEAKDRKELGPLFELQAERVDRDQLQARRRMGHARNVEHLAAMVGPAAEALTLLEVNGLIETAREHLPADVVDRLDEYAKGTYPTPEYWRSFWVDVLSGRKRVPTGRRLEFDPARVTQYNPDGRRVVHEGLLPAEDWKAPFGDEWRSTRHWSKCKQCRRWHAPGQTECQEDAVAPVELPEDLGRAA